MQPFVLPFEEISSRDVESAGGKGASLGELTALGIPVPEGFVILSNAYRRFIDEIKIYDEIMAALDKASSLELESVERASETIRDLILEGVMPADIASEIQQAFKTLGASYVAVRSSATSEDGHEHAWAGQLESYLNVTSTDLINKVQHCFASLFTPRAIFYRIEKKLLDTDIAVAVVVQKLISAEVSGVAFSVHPITEDHNHLIIEASYGLGEAIVSGAVTPDSYVVAKDTHSIIDIYVAKKSKALLEGHLGGTSWVHVAEPKATSRALDDEQVMKLADLVVKIENHYGFPCDIEWALKSGDFYILQSRPITSFASPDSKVSKTKPAPAESKMKMGASMMAAAPVAHDAYDPVRDAQDSLQEPGRGISTKDDFVSAAPNKPKTGEVTKSVPKTEETKINPGEKEPGISLPGLEVLDISGEVDNAANDASGGVTFDEPVPVSDASDASSGDTSSMSVAPATQIQTSTPTAAATTPSPQPQQGMQNQGIQVQGEVLTAVDCVLTFETRGTTPLFEDITCDFYNPFQSVSIYKDGILQVYVALATVEAMRERGEGRTSMDTKEAINNLQSLVAETKKEIGIYKSKPDFGADDTAHMLDTLGSISWEYAYFDFNYWDSAFLKSKDDVAIKNNMSLVEGFKDEAREILGTAYFDPDDYMGTLLSRLSQKFSIDAETLKWYWRSEIMDLFAGVTVTPESIAERQEAFVTYKDANSVTHLYQGSQAIEFINTFGDIVSHFTGNVIEGKTAHPATGAKVQGKVAVIDMDYSDLQALRRVEEAVAPGSIIVAQTASPELHDVMKKSAAIITDVGGMLSYAATAARELNIPCIVETGFASKIIKSGMMVEVDPAMGTVTIL